MNILKATRIIHLVILVLDVTLFISDLLIREKNAMSFCKVLNIKIEVNLVESNWVETQAQVEKSNWNPIKDAKEHYSLCVNWLGLKKIQALRRVKGAECHHKMPTSECSSCTKEKRKEN